VNHVDERYDPAVLDVLEVHVAALERPAPIAQSDQR
jgi:hypothetical protein